jgi:CDP-diacylglycerol--glycerol-3-phosphate 3-phosphatidyltransferase
MTEISVRLHQIKTGYTDGARRFASRVVTGLRSSPVTPNQLTALGLSMNVVAAVLLYNRAYVAAGIVFLVGSLVDILDGALARLRGTASEFGAFIDSTTDRVSEGFMLGAAALVFARDGRQWAIAAIFVALIGSFLVSYTRARAESLGLDGKAGLMGRAERVVLLGAVLLLSPFGALPYGIALLAALSVFTVAQRISSVYRQLHARDAATPRPSQQPAPR